MKWDSRGLRMAPEQEPEVDPRRKEPEKPERFPVRLPVIETQTGQIDVLSRLLKDRILLLGQQVRGRCPRVCMYHRGWGQGTSTDLGRLRC